MKIEMDNPFIREWSDQVNALFTFWFTLEAMIVLAEIVYRPWAEGAYYELGISMVITFGLVIPGLFYLAYNLFVLALNAWRRESFRAAWHATLEPVWIHRSALAFIGALLASLVSLLSFRLLPV